jgi:ferredoxin
MDIPDMMRHIAADRYDQANATNKRSIPLPATLGRVCPEVCERACRRGELDQPAAICRLKRAVADQDLASPVPYVPMCAPATGKHVAIVGAGPTGLCTAHHLLCAGHAVTLFEAANQLGGRLRTQFSAAELPPDVLDAEIALIERLGAEVACHCRIGGVDSPIDEIVARFDAVVLAIGAASDEAIAALGVESESGRVRVDHTTRATSRPGVFAAGQAVRPNRLVIQSVAEGERVAHAVDAALAGRAPTARRPFEFRRSRLNDEEVELLRLTVGERPRLAPHELPTLPMARSEAERCLSCDCAAAPTCRLRHYADAYDCDQTRFRGDRRKLTPCLEGRSAVLDPGKCIACGLCVQITRKLGEPIGLTLFGRGFELGITVPLGHSLDDALTHSATACIAACPTGALSAPRGARPLGCGGVENRP